MKHLTLAVEGFSSRGYTRCVQDPLRLIFFNYALQCHLLASCGVKILEVSAVVVYNFKAQASLHHVL
jgi:hypothetical protein